MIVLLREPDCSKDNEAVSIVVVIYFIFIVSNSNKHAHKFHGLSVFEAELDCKISSHLINGQTRVFSKTAPF